MDKFRRFLFETSGIEQVLKFMNVTPIDYRQSLNLTDEVNLLVGLPYDNKALFLEKLKENGINTTFISLDLVNNGPSLEYLATVLSISKLLDQAKRVKVVLYIGERIDTPSILNRMRNFFKYSRKYQQSVGVLCGWDSFGSEQGLVQRFHDYRHLYPDFVDTVTETDTGHSWKKIGVTTLTKSHQYLQDVAYLMDDTLEYSPLDARDFRFDAYRLTEEVYTKFVDLVRAREKDLIDTLFAQFIPVEFPGGDVEILVNTTRQYLRFRKAMDYWDVGYTDQEQTDFIQLLVNSNVTTSGMESKMSEFSKLYKAYVRLQSTLTKLRADYNYKDLVDQFNEFLESLNKTMIPENVLADVKLHQAKFDAYEQVFYANANASFYQLPTINQTREDVIKEIATRVVTHIETTIKDNVVHDVFEILQNYSHVNEKEVLLVKENNTLILEKLRMFKAKTDKMLPLKLNRFWRLPLKAWYVEGNYTSIDDNWLARLSKYEVLLQKLYEAKGGIEMVYFYLRDLKREDDYVFWSDPVVPGSYQDKIHKIYDEYKHNVSSLIIRTLTSNNILKVDELTMSVVKGISEELKRRLFDAKLPATVEQVKQHKRRLRTVQTQRLDYTRFLESLDRFVTVHYLDKPQAIFDNLSAVEMEYQMARDLLSEEYYNPLDTVRFWDMNFEHAQEVLHTSAAWQVPINFRATLLLVTVLVRKWCKFFK